MTGEEKKTLFLKDASLKTIMVAFTAGLLLFFAYYQYQSYQKAVRTTRQQLQLTTLHGRLIHLDKALTTSARLYVLTGDTSWLQRYRKLSPELRRVFRQVQALDPSAEPSIRRLDSANAQAHLLELWALRLARLNRRSEACAILFGNEYHHWEERYASELEALLHHLDGDTEAFLASRRTAALRNVLVMVGVVVLILGGWLSFVRISRRWQQRVVDLNRRRAEAACEAEQVLEKANKQLHLLSAHLLEVREKERLTLAYDINEELGQQIAAVRIRIMAVKNHLPPGKPELATACNEITGQLAAALDFLRKLASDAYPLVLRDLGLVEALEWESRKLAETSGVTVGFYADTDCVTVDQRTATALFRTFEEKIHTLAINGATEIIGTLREEEGQLVLTVMDDLRECSGKNLIEEVAIEERIRSIKGRVKVEHAQDGNRFKVVVPYTPLEKMGLQAAY